MIPRTAYMHDALGALVGDHLEHARWVLAEIPGDKDSRIAAAVEAVDRAREGIATLQARHGIPPTPSHAHRPPLPWTEQTNPEAA